MHEVTGGDPSTPTCEGTDTAEQAHAHVREGARNSRRTSRNVRRASRKRPGAPKNHRRASWSEFRTKMSTLFLCPSSVVRWRNTTSDRRDADDDVRLTSIRLSSCQLGAHGDPVATARGSVATGRGSAAMGRGLVATASRSVTKCERRGSNRDPLGNKPERFDDNRERPGNKRERFARTVERT